MKVFLIVILLFLKVGIIFFWIASSLIAKAEMNSLKSQKHIRNKVIVLFMSLPFVSNWSQN